ncbi:class I SAM-dependent methyltransferase [Bacillus sp. CLL-7-23]|uniref:S-adenosyl-L-methionine-dependent methyltransferase n=1 Tax=Bacillus changyiensis TaxID=3004103 RepID=A0ABT4X8E7_9BACI|nr:class I SAM-dependent methyltransferase [Bacillus changyiensis]MDA7028546.1 class I SAM-dependent methyltransferase [Bacillus changyiensis]
MKKGESSLTSLISAFARAYHSQFDHPKIFADHVAEDLISQKELAEITANLVQGVKFFNKGIAQKLKGDQDEMLKWITQIQLSPITIARAAYCEKVVLHDVLLGLKQYVILGAGLDTFCFRHPELSGTLEIFEIDYPATQENKKTRLEKVHDQIPDHLHLVPMDFTKTFSYQSLLSNGFDLHKKTLFSLLGVSYYLTKEENFRLIKSVMAQVPSGSSIIIDYADENLFSEKGTFNRVENMVKMAAASGEPMKSCFTYDEMEKLLEEAGLLIYEHLTPTKMDDLYFRNRRDYLSAFETIHYIHAVVR